MKPRQIKLKKVNSDPIDQWQPDFAARAQYHFKFLSEQFRYKLVSIRYGEPVSSCVWITWQRGGWFRKTMRVDVYANGFSYELDVVVSKLDVDPVMSISVSEFSLLHDVRTSCRLGLTPEEREESLAHASHVLCTYGASVLARDREIFERIEEIRRQSCEEWHANEELKRAVQDGRLAWQQRD